MYAIITKKGANWQFEYDLYYNCLIYKTKKYTYFIDPDWTGLGIKIGRELINGDQNDPNHWDEKNYNKELGVSLVKFFTDSNKKIGEFNLDAAL